VNQAVAISSRNEGRYARGFHIEYRGQVQPAVNGFSDGLVLFFSRGAAAECSHDGV
jgi:hypothetical protein